MADVSPDLFIDAILVPKSSISCNRAIERDGGDFFDSIDSRRTFPS